MTSGPVGELFETRSCFCNRRIDLLHSKRVCATRRKAGCPLGRNSKRLQKDKIMSNRECERFVPAAGSACLRAMYLRILRKRRLSAQPSTLKSQSGLDALIRMMCSWQARQAAPHISAKACSHQYIVGLSTAGTCRCLLQIVELPYSPTVRNVFVETGRGEHRTDGSVRAATKFTHTTIFVLAST